MTTFSSRNQSTAVVPASREAIWAVLSDPETLAELTPLVKAITAAGDLWCWRMTFTEGEWIRFEPDPPFGSDQRAGAEGTYELIDAPDGGTMLVIDITIRVELPLPRAARRAVEKVMAAIMARTGDRFARNLYKKLGLDPAWGPSDVTAWLPSRGWRSAQPLT